MRVPFSNRLAAGWLCFFTSSILIAQARDSVAEPIQAYSETILVTATRLPTPAGSVTGPVIEQVSPFFLQSQAPRSLAEAFLGVPGVWMQKTNHAGGSPILRGLTGNQVLLLYDGIRLNNSTYRYGPNQYFNTVDPFSVDRAEVVPGGGAVLYGSDALGGTINLLSKAADFAATQDSTGSSIGVLGRVRSRGMENTFRGSVAIRQEQLAVSGGISLRDFGTLHGGGELGELIATDYAEKAADLKISLKTGGSSVLTAAYNGLLQSGVGRYDQVAQRGFLRYDYEPQERQLGYLRWQLLAENRTLRAIEVTLAGQQSREVRYIQRSGITLLSREDDRILTYSAATVANFRLARSWSATLGAEIYQDNVTSEANQQDIQTGEVSIGRGLYPAVAQSLSSALFTQHRYEINRTTLAAGLRYNPFRIQFMDPIFGNTDIKPEALVWDLSLAHRTGSAGQLRASLGRAFRAPNVNDLSSFGSFDFGIEVPSPGLRPERSLNAELAFQQHHKRLDWQLAVFRNVLSDLIVRERSTYLGQAQYAGQDVYGKVNQDQATISGGGFSTVYRFRPGWEFSASTSYTYGEAAGQPLRRIPPIHGSVTLLFRPAQHYYVNGVLIWAGAQRRLSNGDIDDHRIAEGGTDAWLYGSLRAGWRGKVYRLGLALENIHNAAYRLHGSGVDGAGRHLVLEAGLTFGRP